MLEALAHGEAAMTYERLIKSVKTAKAVEAAKELAVMFGYETQASEDDVEYIWGIENRETGGC
jgi:hypothetical protein